MTNPHTFLFTSGDEEVVGTPADLAYYLGCEYNEVKAMMKGEKTDYPACAWSALPLDVEPLEVPVADNVVYLSEWRST